MVMLDGELAGRRVVNSMSMTSRSRPTERARPTRWNIGPDTRLSRPTTIFVRPGDADRARLADHAPNAAA
jgi:hypothetical protein